MVTTSISSSESLPEDPILGVDSLIGYGKTAAGSTQSELSYSTGGGVEHGVS